MQLLYGVETISIDYLKLLIALTIFSLSRHCSGLGLCVFPGGWLGNCMAALFPGLRGFMAARRGFHWTGGVGNQEAT